MSKQTSYSISVEERDIVVRFNRSCIDMDALSRFLDYVELEAMLHAACASPTLKKAS